MSILRSATIENVDLSLIDAGPNDRKVFDGVKLERLSANILKNGFKGAIILRDKPGGRYEIVAGERRTRAVKLLGWLTIPAMVYLDMSDEEAAQMMLAENESREDLNPVEQAESYESRIKRFGWTVERVAEISGRSVDMINRRLSLLKLVWEAQHLVASGNLLIGHAEAMTALDTNRQRIALKILNNGGMTLSSFRSMVNQLLEEQNQESLLGLESFWLKQVVEGESVIRKGKKARTNAPTRADLPSVSITSKDTAGAIIERYILALVAAGNTAEAGAVGNLYNMLVLSNFASIPENSLLAK